MTEYPQPEPVKLNELDRQTLLEAGFSDPDDLLRAVAAFLRKHPDAFGIPQQDSATQTAIAAADEDVEFADIVHQVKVRMDSTERDQLSFAIEALVLCPTLDAHQIEQCRRIAADRRQLMNEITLLPPAEFAKHLSLPFAEDGSVPLVLDHWIQEHRLIRLRIDGDWRYATCQIDPAAGEPFPALQPVIAEALRQGHTAWEILRWLIEPWMSLDTTPGRRPSSRPGNTPWRTDVVRAVMAQRPESPMEESAALIELLHRGDIPRLQKQAAIWLSGGAAPVSPGWQFGEMDAQGDATGNRVEKPIKLLGLRRSDEVWARVIDVLGSADQARQWLNKPAIALDHRRPIDVIVTPEGAELVINLLNRIDHGVYT